MDILSYLTTLIKTHKEVGIPGLGTIYKRKSPGRYDINAHSFLPPSYTLNFTSDLKEQRLLSEYISKKKNISIDAATYFVEQFSQNILDELSGHQESDFGDLGTFSTTSGSLTFLPKQDSNLGFDFYGLPTLRTDPESDKVKISEEIPLQEEEKQAKVEPLEEKQPSVATEQLELENNNADLSDGNEPDETLSTEVPHVENQKENDEQPVFEEITEVQHPIEVQNSAPIQPIVPFEEPVAADESQEETVHFSLDYTGPEKSGLPAYLKLVIGLVVLILLAGIIYLAKPDLFDGILKKQTVQQPVVIPDTKPIVEDVDQTQIDSVKIAQADSIRRSNEKAILAADSVRDSLAAIKSTPIVAESAITFEIIAASLLNQKEADKFLDDMKARGIPAKVANMPGRRVKISIGSFTNEEAAKKELEVLKKTTKIPGIYVIKVKHTNNPK